LHDKAAFLGFGDAVDGHAPYERRTGGVDLGLEGAGANTGPDEVKGADQLGSDEDRRDEAEDGETKGRVERRNGEANEIVMQPSSVFSTETGCSGSTGVPTESVICSSIRETHRQRLGICPPQDTDSKGRWTHLVSIYSHHGRD
jgi:hypothetical protein